jgi:hypothetical protein
MLGALCAAVTAVLAYLVWAGPDPGPRRAHASIPDAEFATAPVPPERPLRPSPGRAAEAGVAGESAGIHDDQDTARTGELGPEMQAIEIPVRTAREPRLAPLYRQLGIKADGEESRRIRSWRDEHLKEARRLLADLAHGELALRAERVRAYNDEVHEGVDGLIERFGEQGAQAILERIPCYLGDPATGALQRMRLERGRLVDAPRPPESDT